MDPRDQKPKTCARAIALKLAVSNDSPRSEYGYSSTSDKARENASLLCKTPPSPGTEAAAAWSSATICFIKVKAAAWSLPKDSLVASC